LHHCKIRPHQTVGQKTALAGWLLIVRPEDGVFAFIAPWGEKMVAKPGDVIVRNPADGKDTYRVAAASFESTYEIVKAPGRAR
jgi:hypothetical protein